MFPSENKGGMDLKIKIKRLNQKKVEVQVALEERETKIKRLG